MRLDAHGWSLELRPELGGAIACLHHDGHDVLRPTPTDAADALQTACFPLVPYANRIAHGRLPVDGRVHQLPLNFGDHPHSLHGHGWQSVWEIVQSGADHVVLHHAHDGGFGWPWPYRAAQRFTLGPGTMRAELSLTNLADVPAPVGLGFHPYFPATAHTRLHFSARRMWQVDATVLPTSPVAPDYFGDWSGGMTVAGDGLIDHSFDGWSGSAVIEQPFGQCHLEATGASVLHVYRPPDCGFFCIEPVSHLPDAINRDGMARVGAGETCTLSMTLHMRRPPRT